MFQYHGYLVELEYREYKLPESFPCIALLQGEFSFSPGRDESAFSDVCSWI